MEKPLCRDCEQYHECDEQGTEMLDGRFYGLRVKRCRVTGQTWPIGMFGAGNYRECNLDEPFCYAPEMLILIAELQDIIAQLQRSNKSLSKEIEGLNEKRVRNDT